MYTFDLMRAELLIQLATAITPLKEKATGVVYTRLSDQAVTCVENAHKLIMAAKPETATA